jgi:GDP-L-fucose synthase
MTANKWSQLRDFETANDYPMSKSDRIYVAGHTGMVGSAIWRLLNALGYQNLIGWTSKELDLTNREDTLLKLSASKPDYIFMAAARVGGIGSNSKYPVEFLTENSRIQNNVFEAANSLEVDRLLFLGSSCIYPKHAEQPIKESSLMTGMLEPTNDAYAIAKIAGVLHIQGYRREYKRNWISVMPTNLYGPYDSFDLETGHVLPALIRKFHEAKISNSSHVTLWGDGSALREFLHVEDLAKACIALMMAYNENQPINVGYGSDISISELANKISQIVGFKGEIKWDTSKPNGTPKKLLDSSRILKLGWKPEHSLENGLRETYDWFLENEKVS